MSTSVEDHRLVFVGGLHRSGTTPLTRLLGDHPQISAFTGTGVSQDEGQHLQDVYPPASAYGGAGRFANRPEAHLTEASPLVSPSNAGRSRISSLLCPAKTGPATPTSSSPSTPWIRSI